MGFGPEIAGKQHFWPRAQTPKTMMTWDRRQRHVFRYPLLSSEFRELSKTPRNLRLRRSAGCWLHPSRSMDSTPAPNAARARGTSRSPVSTKAQRYPSCDEPPSGSVGRCQFVAQVPQFHICDPWAAGFVGAGPKRKRLPSRRPSETECEPMPTAFAAATPGHYGTSMVCMPAASSGLTPPAKSKDRMTRVSSCPLAGAGVRENSGTL